jgi:serine/threonine-protein kinase
MDKVTASAPTQIAAAPPPQIDLSGRTLDDFRVLRKLGQGGMGQVYLAEQLSLKRKVALKILRADLAANPSALQRFKTEAEAVGRATHANIVQVYLNGEAEGLHYMALEYVEGRNLREFIAKKGPPDILLALTIMRQVAAALARAGELGIIHRDIKPENILLTRKGEVKVADFGLSRSLAGDAVPLNITQSGIVMGTPLYMSPEQVEGNPMDARSDIYSFGVTCYHMMAGHPPFVGKGAFEVAVKHARDEPRPLATIRPDLPQAFCAVIHKMMAKNPDQRYQTCRELLKDLVQLRESFNGKTAAFVQADISVELVPIADLATSQSTKTASHLSAPTPRASQRVASRPVLAHVRRPPWIWLVAGLTVFLALGCGVLLAGYQRTGRNADHGGDNNPKPRNGNLQMPQDAQEVDAIIYANSPQKREKVLSAAVEEYLSPNRGSKDTQVGVGLCVDLAAFYLEQDRLDDAEKLFTRLADFQAPYRTLGRIGRGIVLALRSESVESNKVFVEVFGTKPFTEMGPPPGRPKALWVPRVAAREFGVWNNPRVRFWVAQAVYYNEKNGVTNADLPPVLQNLREVLARG